MGKRRINGVFFDLGWTLERPADDDWVLTRCFFEHVKRDDYYAMDEALRTSAIRQAMEPLETHHHIRTMEEENIRFTGFYSDLNRYLSLGLSEEADIHPANIVCRGAKSEFDIIYHGEFLTRAVIHIPGKHNILNALAAAAAALELGISPAAVKYGLSGFQGAGRRFEFKGKFNGADLYDDYAHHPSELRAVLDAVEALDYSRTIVVFQPHTYSRTHALFQDFVEQLRRPTITYLAEIYAAREKNTIGISSKDLAAQIPGSRFYETFAEIEKSLAETAKPGDIILTIGAGDVFRIGDHLMSEK